MAAEEPRLGLALNLHAFGLAAAPDEYPGYLYRLSTVPIGRVVSRLCLCLCVLRTIGYSGAAVLDARWDGCAGVVRVGEGWLSGMGRLLLGSISMAGFVISLNLRPCVCNVLFVLCICCAKLASTDDFNVHVVEYTCLCSGHSVKTSCLSSI